MKRLVQVIQELSLARNLEQIMLIVRHAARELTGADGATFVLLDGAHCHYADEEAITPLWKGQRFAADACISGWTMRHRQPAIIEDIHSDPRVARDLYRATFVQSLVVVPIRTTSPVGAIGNYWAHKHLASADEVALLAALADSTSIAMETVQLYQTLEQRVLERTAELVASRAALELKHEALLRAQHQKQELSALLAHDLKSPASGIMLSCKAQLRKSHLTEADRCYWRNIYAGAEAIQRIALNLIDVSRSEDGGLRANRARFELNSLLDHVLEVMSSLALGREQKVVLQPAPHGTVVSADRELLGRVLQNLIDNALRFNLADEIKVQAQCVDGAVELRVSDAGPGIPEDQREAIFDQYTRLPQTDEDSCSGHGLGLTFCRIAVESHGGTIWVEPNEPQGSVFVVRIPTQMSCYPK